MLKFWERDFLQNVIVHSFLRRGATVINENEGAILLRDNESGVLCVSATDFDCGKEVLTVLDNCRLIILSQPLMLEYVKERYNLVNETACYQAVYTKSEPLPLPRRLDIKVADDDELEIIENTYNLANPAELKRAQKNGAIFAAHAEGQFCGYIGEHGEGSMGMLEIFPSFRKRGYAAELESFLINKKLEAQAIPYCHIIEDNVASYNLQKKLGLDIAEQKIYWAFKK